MVLTTNLIETEGNISRTLSKMFLHLNFEFFSTFIGFPISAFEPIYLFVELIIKYCSFDFVRLKSISVFQLFFK